MGTKPFLGRLLAAWLAMQGIFCWLPVHAQTTPQVPNRLWMPAGDTALEPFFRSLDALVFEGNRSVNVVHVGGSHVQAGMLTDALRNHLQSWAPGLAGERGFLFPFALAGSNNPSSYGVQSGGTWKGQRCAVPQHQGPWGVSGIRAVTREPGAWFAVFGKTQPYSFKIARVFYRTADSSFVPQFTPQPDSVVYRPDLGAVEAHYRKLQDTVRVKTVATSSQQRFFSLEGIQLITDTIGLKYHAIGVNGAATHSYLKADRATWQWPALAPDLVIFGIGINDAHGPYGQFDTVAYRIRYEALMAQIKAVNPRCSFVFLTNNDCLYNGALNRNTPLAVATMYRLARRNQAAVWDFHALMGGQGSIYRWMRDGLANRDGVHLTREGYALQARWLGDALESAYHEHLAR
jgi:lysophospholipase L1-like esterase